MAKNQQLVLELREDPRSSSLLKAVQEDAALGRMTPPRCIHELALDLVTLSPRFAVEQGKKPDGSVKVRAVDDFSRSGCNAATCATEKLSTENMDAFLASLRLTKARVNGDFEMWKSDIKSAFRLVPIKPEHRQLAWVAFVCDGEVLAAGHYAAPFGALSSVHNWDRIGDLLKAIARCVLFLEYIRLL